MELDIVIQLYEVLWRLLFQPGYENLLPQLRNWTVYGCYETDRVYCNLPGRVGYTRKRETHEKHTFYITIENNNDFNVNVDFVWFGVSWGAEAIPYIAMFISPYLTLPGYASITFIVNITIPGWVEVQL